MADLLPCPFCGNDLNNQDPIDTIYPASRKDAEGNQLWQIVCQEHYGGCTATILGYSKRECIQHWNTRPDFTSDLT
jgi:hypothetical protein